MKEKIQKISLAFLVLTLALLFYLSVEYFSNSNKFIGNAKDVLNLNNDNLISKIEFILPNTCDQSDCWAQTNFNDSKWTNVTLPHFNIRNHPNYTKGIKNEKIYYRLRIAIPQRFLDASYEIAFTPQHIFLDQYEVYLQGNLIASGNGKSAKGNFPIFSLPKKYIENNEVLIGIKGRFDTESTGIFHNEELFLGNITSLSELSLHTERSQVTYHLYWLLTLGTIIIFFSLLFFFTKKKNIYANIIFYGLSVFCAEFFKSEFVGNIYSISTRVYIISLAKVISAIFIIKFFSELFKIKLLKRYFLPIVLITTFCSLYLTYQYSIGSSEYSIYTIFQFLKAVLVIAIFFCLSLSIKKMYIFKSAGKKGSYQFITSIFLLIYFCFYSYFFFSPHYIIEPILDLILCFFIATNTILEFGANEKILLSQQETLRLQTRDVAIGKTAAMMAHDVRKPFAQIKAILEDFNLYKNNELLLSKAQAEVSQSLKKVETMVSEVMDYSRDAQLSLQPTSISQVILNGLISVHLTHKNECIPLTYSFTHTNRPMAESLRLTRCLENLIGNALEAQLNVPDLSNKAIQFETSQRDGHFILKIKNTGILLPSEDINQIFTPFYTSGKVNGTGLGLASVKKIIEQHNGSIKAYNLKEESLICLEISLKLSTQKDSIDLNMPPQIEKCRDYITIEKQTEEINSYPYKINEVLKIKICDDSEIMREYLKSTLEKIFLEVFPHVQFELKCYKNGERLLLALEASNTHLIFTDFHMEKTGGILQGDQVISKVKDQYPAMISILVSSLEDEESIQNVIDSGSFAILKQPLQRPMIVKTLKKYFIEVFSCD